jgi:hypothetical protein
MQRNDCRHIKIVHANLITLVTMKISIYVNLITL